MAYGVEQENQGSIQGVGSWDYSGICGLFFLIGEGKVRKSIGAVACVRRQIRYTST